jgi:hypothetical protein
MEAKAPPATSSTQSLVVLVEVVVAQLIGGEILAHLDAPYLTFGRFEMTDRVCSPYTPILIDHGPPLPGPRGIYNNYIEERMYRFDDDVVTNRYGCIISIALCIVGDAVIILLSPILIPIFFFGLYVHGSIWLWKKIRREGPDLLRCGLRWLRCGVHLLLRNMFGPPRYVARDVL